MTNFSLTVVDGDYETATNSTEFADFTRRAIAYRNACENRAREILTDEKNVKALAILNRWISGECVSEYQDRESCGERAHDMILWLCSMGCG